MPTSSRPAGDTLVVELGDFYGDESRRVLTTLGVPGKAALGLAQVAELELR